MIHDYAYAEEEEDDAPDRDTWCTPFELAKKLGPWDFDPCSNVRAHIIARRKFDLEQRGEDGIVLAKFVSRLARVFCNCPYSRGSVPLWIDAYAHTNFCFLLRYDPSTDWFERLMTRTSLVCTLRERINFEPPPGVEPHHATSNPFPHALFYKRACDATPEILRASYVFQPLKEFQWLSEAKRQQ